MQSEMAIEREWASADDPCAELARADLQARVLEHRQGVFHFCLGFARNRAEAQDLTQETFLRAFIHLNRVPTGHIRPWLLRIARNACIDSERRQRVRRLFMPWIVESEIDLSTPEGLHDREEEIARVRRAIHRLPLHLREVLVLREYNDLSYQEIAAILNLKAGTVMSRLNRARQLVLHHLQEKNHERN